MPSKRDVLEQLKRDELLAALDRLELEVRDRRVRGDIVDTLASSRKAALADLLEDLPRTRLKEICRALSLDDSGREKAVLVARLIGQAEASLPTLFGDAPTDQATTSRPTPSGGDPLPSNPRGRSKSAKKPIEQYEHTHETRVNNPPVGLVRPENDPDSGKKSYQYDPHLDPQLVWAGKAEHTSFEVPTVSLHVHERIDPKTILANAQKRNGEIAHGLAQLSLFDRPEEKPPLREALDFYKHPHGWSNRLITGDSLLVMNSLLEKEGMAAKVQMAYVDPPYGIRYSSNFQPFVNNREVRDGKDEDLTQEPEMIRAFRDTWSLGIHSYLTYLRDRLLLVRELLRDSGSVFVQIGPENVHRVRALMDEVFGPANACSMVVANTTSGFGGSSKLLPDVHTHILWYAKNRRQVEEKYHSLYVRRDESSRDITLRPYNRVELPDGTRRRMTPEELEDPMLLPKGSRRYRLGDITSIGFRENTTVPFEHNGRTFHPGANRCWSTTVEGMQRLATARRLEATGNTLGFVRFASDLAAQSLDNVWEDMGRAGFAEKKRYVVETVPKMVSRCMLMTTDPGDLVLDPTCGSGTTAYVAEQWGRRWITCDTSRVAIALAKQRLMTARYDYYELAHSGEGVNSGFRYEYIPHVTVKSIAYNPEIREGMRVEEINRAIAKYADPETLYAEPIEDKKRARVTGPFTVEAVPAPTVKPIDETDQDPPQQPADASVARSGATIRHADWREELFRTGIRAKGGQRVLFSRVEPLAGTRWLHAEAETRPGASNSVTERAVISFGPEHAPLEQKQVERAWQEAGTLLPKPALLVFAAFQFDPEAAKDIDELTPDKAGMTLLKAQMNPDLLTEDLKKKRSSNESFWLVGQPDVELRRISSGEHKGKWQVEVRGFDYYNPKNGTIESGDASRIAIWMLDPDYDDRSLFPRQVFFPMAGDGEGWARLAKSLRAEIDEEAIEAYRGTVSLPFEASPGQKVAVKVVDDRGIESLRILEVE